MRLISVCQICGHSKWCQDKHHLGTVSQILLDGQHFMINPTNRIFDATKELRDMEHIMHIPEIRWELELVGEITPLSQDSERTNKARCQFSLDLESTNTSEGRDSKIGFVTDFIVNLLMMFIIVALLPGLSNLEILSDDTDFLFSLPDVDDERVRGKEDQVLVFASYVRHRTPRDGGLIKETNDDNERRVMKTFVETATRDEVTCSSWPLSSKLWWC